MPPGFVLMYEDPCTRYNDNDNDDGNDNDNGHDHDHDKK